jgi:manganese-dependent inorganic pyrophosphatase
MAYESLKAKLGESAIAVRLGDINPETAMVLKRFGLNPPPSLSDIRTQIRDLQIDHPTPVSPDSSLWEAWDHLQEEQTKSLPVTDEEGHFLGLITSGDIAVFDMRQIQEASTKATLKNLIGTVDGHLICGPGTPFLEAPIFVAGSDCSIHKDGIVLCESADEDMILRAEDAKVLCLVVCNTDDPEFFRDSLSARAKKITHTSVISSPFGLYRTLRLLTLATSVSTIMHTTKITRFNLHDYLDDVRNAMLSSRYRSYPVVDDYGHVAGMISRFHLIRPSRKKVILVDHNEMAQSFPGLEQAEIVEIIDHHRIGDVTTDGPIYVRNEPVGSTSTIIASMYFERNVYIDPPIAGILLAAILSDTIFFKSPTCTPRDREIAQRLSILSGENIDHLADAMFTPDDSLLKMSARELLNMDFKVFRMSGAKVAISQISAMDISAFLARQGDLLAQMDIDRKLEDYDMIIMALTDITKGGSQILVSGSLGDAIERAYGEFTRGQNSFYLPGVMSRKKQLVPQLSMVVGIG